SKNQLKDIPEAIGHLYQLEFLSLAHNQIAFIPDTIGYLTQLNELDLSHNQIQQLTSFVSQLKSLQVMDLSHNQLESLTSRIGDIQTLACLDLSFNPHLRHLPAELIQLPFLRRLELDGCSFASSDSPLNDDHFSLLSPTLPHDPPSLLETCARLMIKNENQMTERLFDYICSYQCCTHCRSPYFESYVSRIRWIERSDLFWVPIEYRLCSAHWTDENDRLYASFSFS
ncbi:MAG: hypothetical protein EXX96DRAFT_447259, partial [Benjaminiella poitrasii]